MDEADRKRQHLSQLVLLLGAVMCLGKRVGDKRIVSFFLFLIIYRAAYSQYVILRVRM